MVKTGIFFSIDALISIFLVIIVLSMVPMFYTAKAQITQEIHMSSDISNIISSIKVNEINDPAILDLIIYENETNYNISVLEQIGRFYVAEKYELAENISKYFIENYIPNYYGSGIWIDNSQIYSNNKSIGKQRVTTKQVITGIEEGRAIEGYSSKIFLSGINKKTTSSYIFFGGYVGEGNFTQKILLPDSLGSVNKVYLELDIDYEFDLYINNNNAGHYTPSTPYMKSDQWELGSGNFSFFKTGTNNVSIRFPNVGLGSIAGGYIKVAYSTPDLDYSPIPYFGNSITQRYWFPEIDGIINLYDSFYIPGTLESIEAYLHYYNDYNIFLTIGNETVYDNDNATGESIVEMADSNFSSMDYGFLSENTIPLRLGISEILGTLSADVALVTDVSGSMDDCVEWGYEQYCHYDCRNRFLFWCYDSYKECPYTGDCNGTVCGTCGCGSYSNYYVYDKPTECSRKKLDIAKEADSEFVNIILSIGSKKVALVSYETNVDNYTKLSNNIQELNSTIEEYTAGGWTCICCGIYKAVDLLTNASNLNHIVVMSDGDATHKCSGPGDYTGTSDSVNAPQSAIDAGQYACSQGIDVYTVGFGEDISESGTATLRSVACDESKYYNANNVSMLADVYRDVVDAILVYISQQANISYSSEASKLYGDSYIDFTYSPSDPKTQYGKIPIAVESSAFGNNITTGTFNIPEGVDIFDAKLTSYSGDKWTDVVRIQNISTGNYTVFFNLSNYGNNYQVLGDPYMVYIPLELVESGNNQVIMTTATSIQNSSGGSVDNKAIYTIGLIMNHTSLGIYSKSEGCNWFVKFEDNTNGTIKIPADYTGSDECDYESGTYDVDDAINQAAYHLFSQLDIDDNKKLYANFETRDISLEIISIEGVPYMWGPSIMELRVWQ